MKQTARILSTYTADTMGVASALFELGGMTVMHDASGCNSTYNTHDEPRWYDFDSMVYISAMTETQAIWGDDEKLIDDVVAAAQELEPRFIALAGTPIPMMIGTDFTAIAAVVEKRTGIPCFGFPTNGMQSYLHGAGMAFAAFAARFVEKDVPKTENLSVNVLGFTPLDFSVNTTVQSVRRVLSENGIEVVSSWAMGSSFEELTQAACAHVNLVVSQSGMQTALYMQRAFEIPYVVGVPVGEAFTQQLVRDIQAAAHSRENKLSVIRAGKASPLAVVGEPVQAASVAKAITLACGKAASVVCPLVSPAELLSEGDCFALSEEDITACLADKKIILADPLYDPVCPPDARKIALPHEAFSGRIFRKDIIDLVSDFDKIKSEVMK